MSSETKHVELTVSGMTCSNCALSVEKYLQKQGAERISVDFSSDEVIFDTLEHQNIPQIIKGIEKLGYKVSSEDTEKGPYSREEIYFLISLVFTIPLLMHMFFSWHWLHNPWVQLALATPVYLLGMHYFGKSALGSLKGGVPNMDVLISLGATAAFGYSLYGTLMNLGPDFLFYETAASILTLVLLGNVLEHRAVKRTTTAVQALTRLQDSPARRVRYEAGQEVWEDIQPNQIQLGDELLINTGDRIPVDGEVTWGTGTADESMLTGESEPQEKALQSDVIGGTLLNAGSLRIQAKAVGKSTLLSQIIEMVKRAQADKPEIQKLADKISAVFVPAVVGISLLTFLLSFLLFDLSLSSSIIHAVAVLVISCPCAMGLATPTAVVVGIGRASQQGVLIKGGSTLEKFSQVRQMVFDKTGTLTTGQFELAFIHGKPEDIEELRSVVLGMEQFSSHPIAKSLVKALKGSQAKAFASIEELPGQGISATDEQGNHYLLGSYRLAQKYTEESGHSLYVIRNQEFWGSLDLRDEVRHGAKDTIEFLKSQGITPILLSGDRKEKTQEIADLLGIEEVYAEQLPDQKLQIIEALSAKAPTAMVGDGINDAPALAKANVGISLSQATEAAIASAQIVLLNGDIRGIQDLFQVGKHTVLTIKQNLFWAFAYNIVAIPLAAFGFLTPIVGAAAMAFSDVVVIGNSLRLKVKALR